MNAMNEIDLPLSDEDFLRIRKMLYSLGGISLNDSKKPMVGNRLKKRLRTLGYPEFGQYLDFVESSGDEREHFINALTTNLTAFFREEHHFKALADYLRAQPRGRPINIWSAAASTGEEPYSIAITAIEALGERDARRVHVLASDIDTKVLAQAEAGVYGFDRIDKLSTETLRRCFLRGGGANEGRVKVKPEVRALVDFRQINLQAPNWPVPKEIDVIFCRNVMIYFDKETQAKILSRFAPLLLPQGLLIAGHSESYTFASHLFRLSGKTIYRLVNAKEKP